jgi:hypothetical protein
MDRLADTDRSEPLVSLRELITKRDLLNELGAPATQRLPDTARLAVGRVAETKVA